jgi:hypothetical protein
MFDIARWREEVAGIFKVSMQMDESWTETARDSRAFARAAFLSHHEYDAFNVAAEMGPSKYPSCHTMLVQSLTRHVGALGPGLPSSMCRAHIPRFLGSSRYTGAAYAPFPCKAPHMAEDFGL